MSVFIDKLSLLTSPPPYRAGVSGCNLLPMANYLPTYGEQIADGEQKAN